MEFQIGGSHLGLTHKRRDRLFADARAHLLAGQGFALATLNLDHLVKLRADPAFRRAYLAQDMVVADGNPIIWLSRLAGERIELMPGSDLILPLCRVASEAGLPVSMLGATEEALSGAAAHLAAQIPNFRQGLLIAPAMGFDPDGPAAREAAERLASLGPQLCLIALGAPKQERFAAFAREIAPQCGFASIGAGVEFLSGHQNRAPRWMRAMALEWLWRAASQPRRMIPRYIACVKILPAEVLAALRLRQKPKKL